MNPKLMSSASIDADLWLKVHDLIRDHGSPPRLIKSKAHRSERQALADTDDGIENWAGNRLADQTAKSLARSRARLDQRPAILERSEALSIKIIRCVAQGAAWAVTRWPETAPASGERAARAQKSATTPGDDGDENHIMRRTDKGHFECVVCRKIAYSAGGARRLQTSVCGGAIHGAIHESHSIKTSHGIVWCQHCGAYSMRWPRQLLSPCRRKPNSSAQRNVLRRLLQGLHPTTAEYLQQASSAAGKPVSTTDTVSTPTADTQSGPATERAVGTYHRLPRASRSHSTPPITRSAARPRREATNEAQPSMPGMADPAPIAVSSTVGEQRGRENRGHRPHVILVPGAGVRHWLDDEKGVEDAERRILAAKRSIAPLNEKPELTDAPADVAVAIQQDQRDGQSWSEPVPAQADGGDARHLSPPDIDITPLISVNLPTDHQTTVDNATASSTRLCMLTSSGARQADQPGADRCADRRPPVSAVTSAEQAVTTFDTHPERSSTNPPLPASMPMQPTQSQANDGIQRRCKSRGTMATDSSLSMGIALQAPSREQKAQPCQRNTSEDHWIRQVATVRTNTAVTCNSCGQLTRVRCRSCTLALCIGCVKGRRPCRVSGTVSELSSAPT